MIEELQRLLDNRTKKYNTHGERYILRFYSVPVIGFGGLSTGKIEMYLVVSGKSVLSWSTEVKGKTEDVEELACQEFFNWLVDGHLKR